MGTRVNRYRRDTILGRMRKYGTASASRVLSVAFRDGRLTTERYVLTGVERLDIIAGKRYGDSRLWWIIASVSGIGWALQCPPGTVLHIPTNLAQIKALVG